MSRRPSKIELDPVTVRKARSLAKRAGRPIVKLATTHTTVSVERAVLRLAGLQGADPDGEPWVNHLVDAVRRDVGVENGVAVPVWNALLSGNHVDLTALAQKAATGSVTFEIPKGRELTRRERCRAKGGSRRPQTHRPESPRSRPTGQEAW